MFCQGWYLWTCTGLAQLGPYNADYRSGYIYEHDCDMSDKSPILYSSPIERPPFAHNTDSCRSASYNLHHDNEYVYRPYRTISPLPISLDITPNCSTATGPSVAAFESKCLEAVSLNCQAGYNKLESIIFQKLLVINRGVERLPSESTHPCVY